MPDTPTTSAAQRPRLNSYHCQECGGHIVTIDREDGVTPMFLTCRATEGCHGRSGSMMYRVPADLTPTWEWYRPDERELRSMTPEMRDHIDRGGLALRKIALPPYDDEAAMRLLDAVNDPD